MSPDPERRQLLWAGAAFFGVLVLLIAVAAVFAGGSGDEHTTESTVACAPDDPVCRAAQAEGARPGIIPRPGSGHAPEDAGEPGGWGQIAVFAGIVVALTVIGALVARSIRRARRTAHPSTPTPSP
jgi:hypothetical protein